MATSPTPIILVHGAWHGGWSWQSTADLLRAGGHEVHVIDQLPSTSGDPTAGLTTDADSLRKVISSIGEPVALVGHSYGGMVISELAGDPSVVAAIYVAGFVPPAAGMTILDLVGGQLPPWILVDQDGALCSVDPGEVVRLMASNAPTQADAEAHVRHMVPQSAAAFATPSSSAGWGSTPVTYLLTLGDEVIPADGQRAMAGAASATVTEMSAPHIPMLDHTAEVAEFIAETLKSVAH